MVTGVSVVLFLFTLFFVKSQVYLEHTPKMVSTLSSMIVFTFNHSSTVVDRKAPINPTRDNDTNSCEDNGGKTTSFSVNFSQRMFPSVPSCINGTPVLNKSNNIHSFSQALIYQMDRCVNVFCKDRSERTANIDYPSERHSTRHCNGNSTRVRRIRRKCRSMGDVVLFM